MQIQTIITFVIVAGVVWGGLIYFLYSAIKFERKKNSDE